MKSVSTIIHAHVDHFFLSLRHLIVQCIVPHLPFNCGLHGCWTNNGLRSVIRSQLPFHMSIGCHCLVLVWNTHICESAIQECEASQLRDHLELVVFDWNGGNGDLDLDYVSNSESCRIHLKKPGHKHYKA